MRETIIVKDDGGAIIQLEVVVVARFAVEIDCGCWGHRAPWPTDFIISSGGGAYVRCGTEGFYRASDGIGPIRVTVKER